MGHSFQTAIDKERYLTQVIDYRLDDEKRKAMDRFLAMLS